MYDYIPAGEIISGQYYTPPAIIVRPVEDPDNPGAIKLELLPARRDASSTD